MLSADAPNGVSLVQENTSNSKLEHQWLFFSWKAGKLALMLRLQLMNGLDTTTKSHLDISICFATARDALVRVQHVSLNFSQSAMVELREGATVTYIILIKCNK